MPSIRVNCNLLYFMVKLDKIWFFVEIRAWFIYTGFRYIENMGFKRGAANERV